MDRERLTEELGNWLEELRRRVIQGMKELEKGEILEISVSGWVQAKENGYRVDIWRDTDKISGMEEYIAIVDDNKEFLELYSKSLTPTKVKILLMAFEGINEGELSEKTGLRGGALHYHLRDLVLLGLLEKRERGRYITTKYGSFVARSAISAIRRFRASLRPE